MTIEKKVSDILLKLMQDWLDILLQAKREEVSIEARNVGTMLKVNQASEAILALIKPMSETLQADEVTLAFFRKYLEMPDGTLEDLCGEIIRLKAIKPMSRAGLIIMIKTSSLAQSGKWDSYDIQWQGVEQLADAIIAEWEKGLK